MRNKMRKIILVLLLGAVFLPAGNAGAYLYQEATIFGYDTLTDVKVVQLDFAIGIYTKSEWSGPNSVGGDWIYTYIIHSAESSTRAINNLTISGLLDGFELAGFIGNNTTARTNTAGTKVNWTFKFGDAGLGPGGVSDLLYIISTLDPYLTTDTLRSATAYIFGGSASDVAGEGKLPAPGDFTFQIDKSVNPEPVPEPTTLLLIGSGMLMGAASRVGRRKKRT